MGSPGLAGPGTWKPVVLCSRDFLRRSHSVGFAQNFAFWWSVGVFLWFLQDSHLVVLV